MYSHTPKVSTSKVQVFLMKFVFKEAQNSNIVTTILNNTQQPNLVFMTSFLLRNCVQIASEEPFNHHSGLWLFLSHIIFEPNKSQTPKR